MPSAPLSPCRGKTGCPNLTPAHTLCSSCAPTHGRRSASARGYTSYWSKVFRGLFVRQLIRADLAPICGAALPGGPAMHDSVCKREGRITDRRLHLDHDPPLREDERDDRRAVCDPLRVGFLCASCHSLKTNRERRARAL